MLILGIETSCDESAVALYSGQRGCIAQRLFSQIEMHQPFGGIIPELASRDHLRKLGPLCHRLLTEENYTWQDLEGIAYTKGPGLMGALLVGAGFAKSLGLALNVPTLGVHHMESHLLAPFLEPHAPQFPFLALLVSGGHTLLIAAQGLGQYEILGETVDDSVGEAFDKTAKMLGLPYPGGPEIAKLALQGTPGRFHFPRPMLHSNNFNFSYSGLKTHAWQTWQNTPQGEQDKADIAHAFQEAAVDILIAKTRKALLQTQLNQLVVAGGVSANQLLRAAMKAAVADRAEVFYPRHEFCTDNAAMVAYNGHMRLCQGQREDLSIDCRARWPLGEI